MHSKEKPVTAETNSRWPQTPSAILIMGKRQGTKKENKQLRGRVAMAAALWHSAPDPKPYLLFVAADIHGPARTPDAKLVKKMLVDQFCISSDFVMLRPVSNCTLLEVRATRAISKVYGLTHIFALTHLYHAPRAQRYLDETRPNASVIPVHPQVLAQITFPPEQVGLLPDIEATIAASHPSRLDLIREHIVEALLGWAHTFDARGRFERWLAKLLRPGTYR